MTIELFKEKYDQSYYLSGKTYPMVSIRPLPSGTIAFNKSAIIVHKLKTEGFMEIYRDTEKPEIIYFKQIDDETEYSYKMRYANKSLHISPKTFVRKIDIKRLSRFALQFDNNVGLLFINLTKRKRNNR